MGLTPKLVKTVFEAAGIDAAERKARELRNGYRSLPKAVKTEMRAEGVPTTKGQIADLQRKYNLTPKQVRTLAQLQDAAAKSGITNLQRLLRALDAQKADPKVTANTGQATRNLASVQYMIAGIHDKSVTITTYHRTIRTGPGGTGGDRGGVATGGYISGPGTGTSDDIPAWLSNGEYVIKAAAVEKYGTAMFHQLNAMAYADGGFVSARGYATGGIVDDNDDRDDGCIA